MSNFAFRFTTRQVGQELPASSQPSRARKNSFAAASPAEVLAAPVRPKWGTIAPRHFDFHHGTSVSVDPRSPVARLNAFTHAPNATYKALHVLGECYVEVSRTDPSKTKYFPNGVVLVDTRAGVLPVPADKFGDHFTLESGERITNPFMVNFQSPRK